MDFVVYLSNRSSSKTYNNNCSSFTNKIYPPIEFGNPDLYEVALISCILPFKKI